MGNLHRNSLAGHKVLCLVDGCHSASANHALDLQSAVQGFVRLHFGDHAGRESSMDSLQNGDSLVMLWLVSWSTRTAYTASLSPDPWRSAREISYGKILSRRSTELFEFANGQLVGGLRESIDRFLETLIGVQIPGV